jgi:hypothetical protein
MLAGTPDIPAKNCLVLSLSRQIPEQYLELSFHIVPIHYLLSAILPLHIVWVTGIINLETTTKFLQLVQVMTLRTNTQ